MHSKLEENIAAISYGIAFERGTDGSTFYDRWGAEMEGQAGVLRWLIGAAREFTASEELINASNRDFRYDWFLAIDAYVELIADAIDLPSEDDLRSMARNSILTASA